ncbi:uncharacterized protein LOC110012122 [Sesamum indicum]|uniref:Uncharacterized protein LOC110012122 n=1 Tax=Sesamum indicum TaxID=4182 RepID=A0A8M8UUI4_SESIN|nr:uncharacterized protein LOC110012122 [Sesamum indicum]
MADGTRLKEIQEAQKKTNILLLNERARRQASEEEILGRLDQVLEVQEGLLASVLNIEHSLVTLQQQLQSVVEELQQYNRNKSILGEGLTASVERGSTSRAVVHNSFRHEGSNVPRQDQQHTGAYIALNKMEFPYFDGENARSWVRRCTRYFQLIPIPEDQKVPLASIYMQGKAEVWYQGYTQKKEFNSWDELVADVLGRFEDLHSERVMADFNRLLHETTVNAYLEKFEELKDQMLIFNRNLGEEFFMLKFISGLKEEVKSFVSIFNPTSLNQAVILARKLEHTVNAILKRAHQPSRTLQSKFPFKPLNRNLPQKPNFQPGRFLTEAEVKAKKEKNLCYRCDEPYAPGHRCKYRQVYMLLSDAEAKDFDEIAQGDSTVEEERAEEDMAVSLHAMKEHTNSKTLRFNGLVGDREILILIDSGSTHCFIDEKVVGTLGCEVEGITPMTVEVADGRRLTSKVICPKFCWEVQGHKFSHPVRLLKLGSYDLVLGCDWLSNHNPVELDFQQMKVTLNRAGSKVILKESGKQPPKEHKRNNLKKLTYEERKAKLIEVKCSEFRSWK